jgi:UDP-2,3-diacylglucosamine pyrophosphatase LpxH
MKPQEDSMSKRLLVISDLHLADGHAVLDAFGPQQQSAFEELLRATGPGGPLAPLHTPGDDEIQGEVELVINGDCFDLLAIPPYLANGISTPAIACEKLAAVVPVHRAFFAALRRFLSIPGRRVTFITGNHDIELVFAEAQELVRGAIDAGEQGANMAFCKTRFYRPLPDVLIEHGHQYDAWNYAGGIWDDEGQPLSPRLDRLTLPVGTQYFQRASHPISVRYPYFDAFDPPIDSMRQIALFCLLDPGIVIETAQRAMQMLSYPRAALEGLAPGDELRPATLFEKAMIDFAAFQQDMMARHPGWQAVEAVLGAHAAGQAGQAGRGDPQTDALQEFFALREALALPPLEATRVMLVPAVYPMAESVAAGMRSVLHHDRSLRYAIAGHTHVLCHDTLETREALPGSGGAQVYLNTASWTKREALPAAQEVTPALMEWLRDPGGKPGPLRETTRFIFALVEAVEGHHTTARLCEWVGGSEGYCDVTS